MSSATHFVRVFVLLGAVGLLAATAIAKPPTVSEVMRDAAQPEAIHNRLMRYQPADLGAAGSSVPTTLAPMLAHLRKAADELDTLYWQQVSPSALEARDVLRSTSARAAHELADLLEINYGPWDRYAEDRPFLGTLPRPPGANFYPADISRREIERVIAETPALREGLFSHYTVVRRKNGALTAIPYSKAYADQLGSAAQALRDAAGAYRCSDELRARGQCTCDGLATYLKARADSFMNDNYRDSEMRWLDTGGSCPIDVAIGPYEFYEDRLLGVKAAYEAIIYLRDAKESARFERLAEQHETLFNALPLSPAIRERFERVKPSPITIADVLYTSGDARAGFQMRAFLLPNDEVVREAKGTKNVILRNVVKAKFDTLVKPLAAQILSKKTAKLLSFDAYFDTLLSWQLAHSVVPGPITQPDGTTTTARERLRERATIIQAVKGEAVALVNYFSLADGGMVSNKGASKMAATYLASLFDGARLASASPQTIAKVIVYNYFAAEWVFRYNPRDQRFEVNPPAMRKAARKLAAETLEIMARGDYDGAGRLIVQYGIMPGEMRQKLASLGQLPLDIRPRYTSVPKL